MVVAATMASQNCLAAKKLPACGFAIGIERLLLLLQTVCDARTHNGKSAPDIAITSELNDGGIRAQMLACQLRRDLPGLNVLTDCSSAKLKRQHQNALKSGCQYILTINYDENLRLWNLQNNQQESMSIEQVKLQISEISHK